MSNSRTEYHKEYSRKRRQSQEYRDRMKALKAAWYQKNKESVDVKNKINHENYLKTPNGYSKKLENNASRRASKKSSSLMRDDEWNLFVCSENYDLARVRSKETGIEWHVDHIIPLRGETVCGLHVWYNLQTIPAKINQTKSNSFLV